MQDDKSQSEGSADAREKASHSGQAKLDLFLRDINAVEMASDF